MSEDARLARAPRTTYERLAGDRVTGSLRRLAGRLALSLAAITTGVGVNATGRVSLALVTTIALSWGFALAIQAVAAAAIILPAGARQVSTLRAFELWFLAHVPWSLWLLTPAIYSSLTGSGEPDAAVAFTALVPFVWTLALLHAFCAQVLRSRTPRLHVALHQVIVWGLALTYIQFAIGGWDRVLTEIGL